MDHRYSDQKGSDAFAKTPIAFESQASGMEETHQAPPPPYSQQTPIVSNANKPQTSERSSFSAPLAQPSPLAAPPRTMDVRYKNWKNSGIRILDSTTNTELYTIRLSLRKPHMIFQSATTGSVIGTVTFHTLSYDVETVIHGTPVKLTGHGFTRSRYTYPSPALGGATLTWKMKSHGLSIDFECLDEQRSVTLARFRFSNWSLKQMGTLEVMDPVAGNEGVVEEIVVTSLVLAELLLALLGVC